MTALLVGILAAASLAAVLAPSGAQAKRLPPPRPHSYADIPGVSVQGGQLVKNGFAWVPRGVQIVGLVAPNGALGGKYLQANEHYSAAELSTAVADHADMVRFQVSEFGLDPEGPLYSPGYVQEVRNAVATARSLGLMVIVSLQAEPPAGEPVRCPLPDAGAQRVWEELAPMFGGDRGVMFELYNEPALDPTAANWQTWLYGGAVTTQKMSCQAVGMQTLVDDIRVEGADNVIVIPGLAGEQTLAGMPQVSDPTSPQQPQFAYGVHYPTLTKGVTTWDREFGGVSASKPEIVTEWDASATGENCLAAWPKEAQLLLDYLASKQIGLVGFSFDIPGTIIANWSYAPTTYTGFACGVSGGGPGQILFGEYAGMAQAGDGTRSNQPPAWLVSAAELKQLAAKARRTAAGALDTPRTFVSGAGTSLLARLSVPAAIPTATFTNESTLAAAIRRKTLPAGTKAVVFDDEHWKLTPKSQQQHPAQYYERAAQIAHNHNLLLIAAPATDLVSAIKPHTKPAQLYSEFLKLGIAAGAAKYADVYDVQAQNAEAQPGKYGSFVRSVRVQALSAHPGVELLSGISTNPQGVKEQPTVLLDAALAAQPLVSGYTLSDPTASSACPSCTGPYTSVLASFLRKLLR